MSLLSRSWPRAPEPNRTTSTGLAAFEYAVYGAPQAPAVGQAVLPVPPSRRLVALHGLLSGVSLRASVLPFAVFRLPPHAFPYLPLFGHTLKPSRSIARRRGESSSPHRHHSVSVRVSTDGSASDAAHSR